MPFLPGAINAKRPGVRNESSALGMIKPPSPACRAKIVRRFLRVLFVCGRFSGRLTANLRCRRTPAWTQSPELGRSCPTQAEECPPPVREHSRRCRSILQSWRTGSLVNCNRPQGERPRKAACSISCFTCRSVFFRAQSGKTGFCISGKPYETAAAARGTLALRARPSAQWRRRLICSSIVLASGTVCASAAKMCAVVTSPRP